MAFTMQELENIATAALDHHIRGPAHAQTLQARPLYDAMRRAQKTFSGGKGEVTKNIKGQYSTTVAGYTHNDTVSYVNPANLKRVSYAWKEHHGGIGVTLTELKHDGISVVDSLHSRSTTDHSEVELTRITGLLQDKLDDMSEGWARSFDALLHGDGTSDTKALAGIQAFLSDDPTSGVIGGIDRATTPYFRHRARTAAHATATSNPANGPIDTASEAIPLAFSREVRQLRRYGGNPRLFIAGSAFIEALEGQLYEKGQFTQQGWTASRNTDIGIADIAYNGIKFVYDPTLDDLGMEKRCYVIDTKRLFPYVMEGEDMKQHAPARPYNQYVMYRAITWTGMLFMDQANCHGVYDIA